MLRFLVSALIVLSIGFTAEAGNNRPSPINAIAAATPLQDPCIAPCGVKFAGWQTTAPTLTSLPLFDLEYEWDFGDPDSGVHSKTSGRSRNTSYGFNAAHVYDVPGIYVATLRVRTPDSTQVDYAQVWITVVAEDDPSVPADFEVIELACGSVQATPAQTNSHRGIVRGPVGGCEAPAVKPRITGNTIMRNGWTLAGVDILDGSITINAEHHSILIHDVDQYSPNTSNGFVGMSGGGTIHNARVGVSESSCKLKPAVDVSNCMFMRVRDAFIIGTKFDNEYTGEFNLRFVHAFNIAISDNVFTRPGNTNAGARNWLQIRSWAATYGPLPSPNQYVTVFNNVFNDGFGPMGIRQCGHNQCTEDGPNGQPADDFLFADNTISNAGQPNAFQFEAGRHRVRRTTFSNWTGIRVGNVVGPIPTSPPSPVIPAGGVVIENNQIGLPPGTPLCLGC